ncbi:mycothiol system anti-sigma-R factor [Actinacidiphila yeochonensis]|uniref:mycothiol system anti-sigma-R factor n=1 Tax=Actinacidiphila yeochonensis TaxID=89050 RepID=UPI0005638029|nr:mycothiol system anti-sigma-R factor [Actinacidiphila yeochonensis]
MSCGNAHETDCSEVLNHLYEYLDHEMSDEVCDKFREHFDECHPCLEKYGLEVAVKKLVKRCCGSDDVPSDLRAKVMMRIELVRSGEVVPEQDVHEAVPGEVRAGAAKPESARADATASEAPSA